MTERIYPTELTDELKFILGRPNFVLGPIAHIFRATGEKIPFKAEEEQAFVMHWLIGLYLEHGKAWHAKSVEHLAMLNARIITAGLTNDQ